MSKSGTLGHGVIRKLILGLCGCLLAAPAWGQSEDRPVPLGDVARSLRKKKEAPQLTPAAPISETPAPPAPARTVIDNDNLSQVMEEAESRHLTNTSFLYSFNGAAKTFEVSSPDVTCSLSFNGKNKSLLSRPLIQLDLPDDEVRKLEGPATINEEGLQVALFNGTTWRVEEITVGLTMVHKPTAVAARGSLAKLVPAAQQTTIGSQKEADVTTKLYHLRAVALPSMTAVFKAPLDTNPGTDQEWHWTIVQARGIPPRPEDSALSAPMVQTNNAVIP